MNILFQKIASILLAPVLFFSGLFNPVEPVEAPLPLGATNAIPTAVALFETSLANSITSTATTMTLVSATDKDGNTLASSTYAFIIDEGSASEEFVLADCTGTACTNMTRGISVLTGTTSVAALKKAHRRGASVKITDAPSLLILTRTMNGQANFPNVIKYDSSVTPSANDDIADVAYVNTMASTASTSVAAVIRGANNTFTGNNTFSGSVTVNYSTASSSAASVGYTNTKVSLTGDETIAGVKTFSSLPQSAASPTVDNDLATKAYVDAASFAGVSNASETAKGIVEQATKAEAAAGTTDGASGARLFLPASMATSTSQVATTSVVITNTSGKIDPSFLNGSESYSFGANTSLATTTRIGAFSAWDGFFKQRQIITSTGTSTFSVPTGVTKLWVEAVGGGGSGANGVDNGTSGWGGGGGGSGGYSQEIVDVTGTSTIQVYVGAAGEWTTFGTNGSYLYAMPGANAGSGGNNRKPGAGGTASGGDLNIPGGDGFPGPYESTASSGVGSGGSGGSSMYGRGGMGGSVGTGGTAGHVYGGGGGGGAGDGDAAYSGAAGAQGILIIRW